MENLLEIVNNCYTKADVCRALGLKPTGGNYSKVDRLLKLNNIDFSHYQGLHWKKGKKVKGAKQSSLEELLVEDSTCKNSYRLKNRLIKSGLKEYKCEICGYTDKVELHHINGNPLDNRLENLQILCPNCHSKTPNYRSKNSHIPSRTFGSARDSILSEDEIKKRENSKKRKTTKSIPIYKIELTCNYCGKLFYAKTIRKYCSQECSHRTISNRPSVLLLIKDFEELKSFVQVGKKYNVSDNAVRKWCKLYGLPIHSKEILKYIINL